MVSRGPYTISYLPTTPSPVIIQKDLKGGLMEQIKKYSPQFAKVIQKAQMEAIMNEQSNITVFAPCNEYNLTDGLITVLGIGQCKDLVNASISPHVLKKSQLEQSSFWEIPSKQRFENMVVRVDPNHNIFINNSQIVEADICATNGMLHLITGLVHS